MKIPKKIKTHFVLTPVRSLFPTGQAFIFLNGLFAEFLNAIFKMVIFQLNHISVYFEFKVVKWQLYYSCISNMK